MWTSEASLLKSSWNNRNVMWTFSPGHATIIHSLNKVEWGFHAWPTSRLPCPWKFVAMHGAGANQSHPRVVLQLLCWSSRCRWCLNTADASIGPRFMKMFYGKFFMFGCFSVGSSCWLALLFWSKTHSHAFVRNLPWFLRGLFVFNDCFSHLVRQWTRLGRFRTSKVTWTTDLRSWKPSKSSRWFFWPAHEIWCRFFHPFLLSGHGHVLRVFLKLSAGIGTICYEWRNTFNIINIPPKLHCTEYMLHS